MSFLCCALLLATLCSMPQSGGIDLTAATVVVRENGAPVAEKTAVTVLVEEAEKRTGVRWTQQGRLAGIGRGRRGDFKSRPRRRRTKRAGRGPQERDAIEAGRLCDRRRRHQAEAAGRLGRRGRCAWGTLRRRQVAESDETDEGRGDARRNDKAGHVAGISDSRPPARLPQSRQLIGRLGCAAVRSIHSRACDLRRQLRREHPISGRLSRSARCASRARR